MTIHFIWLTVCAFLLGACPFSLWIGSLLLHKDIRRYGDGNPGAVNVFRAGNPAVGMLALSFDLFKGIPAVYAASKFYHLPESQVLFIAFAAILGHAFSPLLRLHGGKAVAVTFGVLIGLGRPDMLFPFAVAALVGFILLQNHSWVVLGAAASDMVYVFLHGSGTGPLLFMTGVLLLYVFKHFRELNGWPRPKPWLYRWLQSRRQI